jgi:NAD(P)-dependent dehydrogenase (short-subunit alcohol dehydrogenase family)
VAVNFHQHAEEASAVCAEIERLGRRALAVQAGVASAGEVAQMVESVERQLGGTDILVDNASISRPHRQSPAPALSPSQGRLEPVPTGFRIIWNDQSAARKV